MRISLHISRQYARQSISSLAVTSVHFMYCTGPDMSPSVMDQQARRKGHGRDRPDKCAVVVVIRLTMRNFDSLRLLVATKLSWSTACFATIPTAHNMCTAWLQINGDLICGSTSPTTCPANVDAMNSVHMQRPCSNISEHAGRLQRRILGSRFVDSC
jgi:hypothetical protein